MAYAQAEPGESVQRLAFSPAEAAEALGVARATVYELLTSGQLKSIKVGRRRLISRAALDAFIANAEAEGEVSA